jgi:hypothetical protein
MEIVSKLKKKARPSARPLVSYDPTHTPEKLYYLNSTAAEEELLSEYDNEQL